MFRTVILSLAATAAVGTMARAEVKTQTVEYTYDGTSFKGVLAYDDAVKEKRPGVLVVHEWWGLNDYAKERAIQLAKLGYVAFAADMYGGGKTTEHPKEAGEMATAVRKNADAWKGRAFAALKVLQDSDRVDPKKLAAIGYCFGGSTAQVLAFAGADLAATVSFHGALVVPTDEQVKGMKGKLLICHGADDKFIPAETVEKFKKAIAASKNVEFVAYPGVVHSFTVKDTDKVGNPGMKYDAKADEQSWASMKKLFEEAFKK